jgi:2-octaprenyl-6-methoxyphenol hydroxylase
MYDVIIIGQSYIGTLTALMINQSFPCLSIAIADQRSKRPSPSDLRATALSRSSIHLLKELSLWDKLQSHAAPLNEIHIGMDTSNTPLIFNDKDPLGYNIENAILKSSLQERLGNTSQITLINEASVSAISLKSNFVTVEFTDLPPIQGRLLIGADGRHSSVRKFLSTTKTIDYQQTALTGTIQHESAHNYKAYEFFIPQGPLAFIPLKDQHHSTFVWSIKNHLMINQPVDELLSQLAGSYLGRIQHSSPIQTYPLQSYIATPRCGPRWVLVGDAANAIHPVAGQGMNLAIRDIQSFIFYLTQHLKLGLDIGSYTFLTNFAQSRQIDRYSLLSITHASAAYLTTPHQVLRKIFEKGMQTFEHQSILSGIALRMASEGYTPQQ